MIGAPGEKQIPPLRCGMTSKEHATSKTKCGGPSTSLRFGRDDGLLGRGIS
jgi:hypothetical protein